MMDDQSLQQKVIPESAIQLIVKLDSETTFRKMKRVLFIVDGIRNHETMPDNITEEDLVIAVQWFLQLHKPALSVKRIIAAFEQQGVLDFLGNKITGTKLRMAEIFLGLKDQYVFTF